MKTRVKKMFVLPALTVALGLLLDGRAKAQIFTTLHGFTLNRGQPAGGLILSGNTLYGAAANGGGSGKGAVFAVNTNGLGFTNLHSFTGNGDGGAPSAGLLLSDNTLYGTTFNGGSSHLGTVFKVNTDGSGFTNLYSFTATSGPNSTNSDGIYPEGGLILTGNTLYGTANQGGISGAGTVFSLSPGSISAPQLTIIHSGANVILTWPVDAAGFTLQSTLSLASPAGWSAVSPAPVVASGNNTVTNAITGPQQFFRLRAN